MPVKLEPVVVTGVGAICPLGVGVDALVRAIASQRSGVDVLELDATSRLGPRRAGRIRGYDVDAFVGPGRSRRMDRLSTLAVGAAWLAVRDAGLQNVGRHTPNPRVGLAFGSAYGCQSTELRYAEKLVEHGAYFTNPIDFPDSIDGAPAAHVAMELGIQGPSTTHADAGLSGELALYHGWLDLAIGRADRVLVGGGDVWNPLLYDALEPFGHGPRPEAPPGEGVAFLVLERADDAAQRAARTYARITAVGQAGPTCGHDRWPDDPGSSVAALAQALDRAQIRHSEVGAISLLGAGDAEVERLEAGLIDAVFSEHAPERLALYPLTGQIAGGGVLRIGAACAGLHQGLFTAETRLIAHHTVISGGQSFVLLMERP